MAQKNVLYYAHGVDGDWEAICVDFDIAVQGRSCDEVIAMLDDAVRSYVEFAHKEDAATARRLLSRRTPFLVHAQLWLAYVLSRVVREADERTVKVDAELPCAA